MRIIVLDKEITVLDNIDELVIVNLEDSLDYLTRSDGVLVKGKVDIIGEYLCNGAKKHFKDRLDVNIIVPYDNLVDKNAVSLKIEDFDYVNGGKKIVFTFKVKIEGWKDTAIVFQPADAGVNQQEEQVLNDDIIVIDEPNQANEINKVIKKYQLEEQKNEYLHEEKNTEEIEDEVSDTKEKDIDNSDDEFEESFQEVVEDSINFNIKGSENVRNSEDLFKQIDTSKDVKGSFLDDLFKSNKVTHQKIWSYYVILTGDTYESIAVEKNLDVEIIKKLNQNITLSEGQIIKLPNPTKLL